MLTWLDSLVRHCGEMFADITRTASIPVEHDTDFDAASILLSVMAAARDGNRVLERGSTDERVFSFVRELVEQSFHPNTLSWFRILAKNTAGLMAGFDPNGRIGREPLAVQITPELAHDFYGLKADEKSHDYIDLIKKHGSIYIDFPQGCFNLMGEYDVRAILVNDISDSYADSLKRADRPVPKNPFAYDAMVILQRPGKFGFNNMLLFGFISEDRAVYGTIADPAYQGQEFVKTFTDQIADLVKVTLLYFATGDGEFAELPKREHEKTTAKATGKGDKNRTERLKHFTLFRVFKLNSPRDHFGRPTEDDEPMGGEGHKLGTPHMVTGFLRRQRCGPGGKDRKVQWIDAYPRGGTEEDKEKLKARFKPQELHVLKSKF